MSSAASAPLIIWRFTDGRRGHDAQSRGLALALAALRAADIRDIPVSGPLHAAGQLLARRFDAGRELPDPHLLLGAGHGTHLPLLAARRARGGRIVVLMRPSLPTACFDLCLVPDHDGVPERGRVVLTRGPLNALRPAAPRRGHGGLILVGGTSRHYRWDENRILEQVRAVLAAPGPWTLADSPRTPAATRATLRDMPGTHYLPWEQGGLPGALAGAANAWVTADSLSMIYEALTAGAAVGVIELSPSGGGDRAAAALRRLRAGGQLTVFADWNPGSELPRPSVRLAEAERCAALVLARLC